jgi:hypothetical protein
VGSTKVQEAAGDVTVVMSEMAMAGRQPRRGIINNAPW